MTVTSGGGGATYAFSSPQPEIRETSTTLVERRTIPALRRRRSGPVEDPAAVMDGGPSGSVAKVREIMISLKAPDRSSGPGMQLLDRRNGNGPSPQDVPTASDAVL